MNNEKLLHFLKFYGLKNMEVNTMYNFNIQKYNLNHIIIIFLIVILHVHELHISMNN